MKRACLTNTDGFLDDKSLGSDYHLTMLMAPYSLNFVVGEDRQALLKWGRDVWAAAIAFGTQSASDVRCKCPPRQCFSVKPTTLCAAVQERDKDRERERERKRLRS